MKKILSLALVVLASSCVELPHAGDMCEASACDYLNPSVALECMDGSYKAFPCAGGCGYDRKGITCDPRGAQPGDLCPPALGGLTTCSGNRQILTCFSGIWQVTAACDAEGLTVCKTDSEGVNAQCLTL